MMSIPIADIQQSNVQDLVRPGGPAAEGIRTLARNIRARLDADPTDRQRGLIELPKVDRHANGTPMLVDGHRRAAAFALLADGDGSEEFPGDERFETLPVQVHAPVDDTAALLAALDSNSQEGLSVVGRAQAYAALIESGMERADLCARYSISASALSNMLRLLDLPDPILSLIHTGDMPENIGRELIWLARYLPADVLGAFIHSDGVGLWSASQEHEYGATKKRIGKGWLLQLKVVQSKAQGVVFGNTRAITWRMDWEPPANAGLRRRHACEGCHVQEAYKKQPRCLDRMCWLARSNWHTRHLGNPNTQRMTRPAPKPGSANGAEPRAADIEIIVEGEAPAAEEPLNARAAYIRQAYNPTDFTNRRRNIHKAQLASHRRDFAQAHATDDALFGSYQFLQFLERTINAGRTVAPPVLDEPETELRRRIINGVLLHAGVADTAAHLERVIEMLGGDAPPDDADLPQMLAIDAEELYAIATADVPSWAKAPAVYIIEKLETFPTVTWGALTDVKAERVDAALRELFGWDSSGEHHGRIAALLGKVEFSMEKVGA